LLEKALKLETKDASLYVAMGYVHSLIGKNADALKFYNMALEVSPDDPRVHFSLGALYEKIGSKETAIKEFRQTIKLDPNFSDAYNYLGYMFAEDGVNLDEAVGLAKKALESDPDNGAYLDSLGWIYFKKGMYNEALAELEKAVKSDPGDPTIKGHLETVRKKLKK
jgi:tetratricopeptide (TPR) repeat protein